MSVNVLPLAGAGRRPRFGESIIRRLAFAIGLAAAPVTAQDVVVQVDAPGCRSLEHMQTAWDLLGSKDKPFSAFHARHWSNGDCINLKRGDVVLVMKQAGAFVCLRRKDDPDCYWSPRYTAPDLHD